MKKERLRNQTKQTICTATCYHVCSLLVVYVYIHIIRSDSLARVECCVEQGYRIFYPALRGAEPCLYKRSVCIRPSSPKPLIFFDPSFHVFLVLYLPFLLPFFSLNLFSFVGFPFLHNFLAFSRTHSPSSPRVLRSTLDDGLR